MPEQQNRTDRRSLTPSTNHENKKRKDSKHRTSFIKHEFDDARLFCDNCNKFYDNICPYHKQIYIPDKKVWE